MIELKYDPPITRKVLDVYRRFTGNIADHFEDTDEVSADYLDWIRIDYLLTRLKLVRMQNASATFKSKVESEGRKATDSSETFELLKSMAEETDVEQDRYTTRD